MAAKPKVVIIGSGAAGLNAALDLKDKADVVVLEAQDRIGGRLWTANFKGGGWADIGAAFVDGYVDANPAVVALKKQGVKVNDNFSVQGWGIAGKSGTPGTATKLGMCKMARMAMKAETFTTLWEKDRAERNKKYGQYEGPDESLWEGVRKLKSGGCRGFAGLDSLDEESFNVCKFFLQMRSENDYHTPMEQASYRWNEEEYIWGGPRSKYPGETVWPVGGWEQQVTWWAEGLNIRSSCVVKAVKQADDGVVVQLESGEELTCAACICTVPNGVLQAKVIDFSPPFATPKQEAIDKMYNGSFNRVAIKFDKQFWGKEVLNLRIRLDNGRADPDSLEPIFFLNFEPVCKHPILIVFFAAEVAERVERLSDEETVELCLTKLEQHYGKQVRSAKVQEYYMTRWKTSPFFRGTYCSCPVGVTGENRDILAAPHGSVFFAGESTMKGLCGSVAGAMLSGRRAAKEVVEHLKLGLGAGY